jgi:hypothetical protein
MTTEQVYGYVRLSLLGSARQRIDEQFQQVAVGLGSRVRRVFAEPDPPVDVLWSLIVGLDRVSGGQMVSALIDFAERGGVDIRRVLGRRGTAGTAWQALLAELGSAGGGYVVVPSPDHLDGVAESRSALLHYLSQLHPRVNLLYLSDRAPADRERSSRRGQIVPDGGATVLVGEFVVKAFATALEVALPKAWWHLSQAGLSYRAGDVEALLRALIGTRVAAQPPLGELNEIRIRLLRTSQTLVVDLHETGNHAREPVPAAVRERCSRVQRVGSVAGGTLTWCELPLADPTATQLAHAVRRYQQISAAAAGGAPW